MKQAEFREENHFIIGLEKRERSEDSIAGSERKREPFLFALDALSNVSVVPSMFDGERERKTVEKSSRCCHLTDARGGDSWPPRARTTATDRKRTHGGDTHNATMAT